MIRDRAWFEEDVLTRFLRYAKIHTTSNLHSTETPSTPGQFELARLLVSELKELGIREVVIDDHCFVTAIVPGNVERTPVGFMAHLDTSPDEAGENVHPQVISSYDGNPIALGNGVVLDPDRFPTLSCYAGETIVTTDGTTLLGADDKAGIAEIMTAVRYLIEHPELPRPPVEVIFTPDEETAHGMDLFPKDRVSSDVCYTLDGSDEGTVEAECFTAFRAVVTFTGVAIHPGTSRGRMANAAAMAAHFVSAMPRSESPEATDGRYGYYMVSEMSGGVASATAAILVRDFDMAGARRRLECLEALARAVEASFPGGKVSITAEQQYLNMAEFLKDRPEVLEFALEAIRMTGLEPMTPVIRGGTDGARLSEMGIPTPNIFTGGQNYHGRLEWIALPAMVRAAKTLVNLVQLFARGQSA